MPDRDIKEAIIATSMHGEKYLGWATGARIPPISKPITLECVHLLLSINEPQVAPDGSLGLQTLMVLLPIDAHIGPAPRLRLHCSTIYQVGDSEDVVEKITELLQKFEDNMQTRKAREAGLLVPMPMRGVGKASFSGTVKKGGD